MKIGPQIRMILAVRQIKCKYLATALGVRNETVTRWRNNREISSKSMDKLLAFLDMTVVEFLQISEMRGK